MKKLASLLLVFLISIQFSIGQDPSIVSYDTHTLCPESYEAQLAISNIIFDSPGGDSVYISEVTSPTLNSLFYDNETASSMVSLGSTGPINPDTYDIEIDFTYDGGSIYSETIQITVAEIPNVIIEPASICDNIGEFDLNTLVNLKGGSFMIYINETSPPDGIMDLDEFTDMYPSETSFEFQYDYVDEFGCYYNYQPEEVQLLPAPEITLDYITDATCNDSVGEISTTVNSPSANYEGYWNNGTQNTDIISDLPAGDYFYTVESDNGCTDQIAATVEMIGFDISGTVTDVKCKGGSDGKIDIDITGGSGDYKMIWTSGHSNPSVNGLSAGMYSVTVTDLNSGCVTHKSFTIDEPSEAFSGYFSTDSPTNCTSSDGKIYDFQHNNGIAPFDFIWSNGETTEDINNLPSGVYSVEITDESGCEMSISMNLNSFSAPGVYAKLLPPTCEENNGAIQLMDVYASGSEEISGYSWSNGSETRNINGLAEGNYTLEVTQTDGCVGIFSYDLNNKSFEFSPEICIVTVDTATNTNLVVWEKEFSNPQQIDYYNVYRANSINGDYQLIDTVDFDNISVFNDVVVSPEVRSWMYKISAVNICGQESNKSPHHKTIHLVMNDDATPGTKKLSWDHYEGLDYFYYNLYRGTDIDGWQLVEDEIPITSLPDFTDTPPAGATEIDYIVEVVPTSGGCTATFGKAQDYNSSRSNKPSPIFDPGSGTGDPSNSLMVYDNLEFKALVYPNPSRGTFKVEIKDKVTPHNLSMSVMGMNGKTVHEQEINEEVNTVQLNADAGVYFVQIQGRSSVENIRIVVK